MRKLTVGALFLSVCLANTVSADYYHKQQGCKIKLQKLERQLEYAKSYGNTNRVYGLQRAIENVKTYCLNGNSDSYTINDKDSKKYYDVLEDLEEEVEDKKEDVAELREELQEAIFKGDPKKIAKKKRKLAEAISELKEAEDNLSSFKQ